MLKKILITIGILSLLVVVGFVFWALSANPIMPAANQALVSDGQVQVTDDRWLAFQPVGQGAETGLIFYPGGRVNYRAYAPIARAVAAEGFLVIVVPMPLNMAVFNPYAAEDVIKAFPEIRQWVVGGHSLGGAMAANFTLQYPGAVEGLLLLAAYPANSDDLSSSGLEVVSVYASNDGLATVEKIEASRTLLPAGTKFVLIEGGNHAQFGDYGEQGSDGSAAIDRAEQQAQAVSAALDLLRNIGE